MTPEPHHVQVEIFGQTYKLRSEDDPAYVESLAAVVDRKMREIATKTNAVDSLRVAILAALNIADESNRAASPGGRADSISGPAGPAESKLERRVEDLVSLLDDALAS